MLFGCGGFHVVPLDQDRQGDCSEASLIAEPV